MMSWKYYNYPLSHLKNFELDDPKLRYPCVATIYQFAPEHLQSGGNLC